MSRSGITPSRMLRYTIHLLDKQDAAGAILLQPGDDLAELLATGNLRGLDVFEAPNDRKRVSVRVAAKNA